MCTAKVLKTKRLNNRFMFLIRKMNSIQQQQQGVVHCDIKPANVFLTSDGTGVIGDFDVSRNSDSRTTTTTTSRGGHTLDYAAPELSAFGARSAAQSDIFSLGLTIFDTFFTPTLYIDNDDDDDDNNNNSKRSTTIEYRRPTLNDHMTKKLTSITIPSYANEAIDSELRDLLSRMLSLDATQRPTALQVLAHPLFQLYSKPEGNEDKREMKVRIVQLIILV